MKMKAISLHLQEAYTSHVKRLAYGTAGTKIARQAYSHASESASYFISTLIRTSSTLFSTTSVSNGIGTTVSIFIVGLGSKHFLRCDNTNNKLYCSLCRSLQQVLMNIHYYETGQ